ncbi:MAG: hypothetical protein H0U69_02470 [Trueperaceae bacterium]|nr:hypothetical protein [Trueperaceae bacterium]
MASVHTRPNGRSRAIAVVIAAAFAFGSPIVAQPESHEVRDSADVVRIVGSDPKALSGWVATRIVLDPYPGAMRGADGALLAGAASPADMSLLLHALLAVAQPSLEVRFARCTLAPDEVARTLHSLAPPDPPLPWLARLPSFLGIVDDDVREVVEDLAAVWQELVHDVTRHTSWLDGTIAAHGWHLALPVVPEDRLRSAAAEHIWLQAHIDSAWTDLDPSADAPSGRRRCEATWTGSTFPEELLGRLSITVEVEVRARAGAMRESLLTAAWPMVTLVTSPPAVLIAEAFGDDLTPPREPTADGLLRYTPAIVVGETTLLGEPFWLPTPTTLDVEPAGGAGGIGGAIGNVMGGLFGSPDEPDDAGDGGGEEAVALWLVFTMTMSDGSEERVERAVFDRLGHVAREEGGARSAALTDLHEVEGEYRALATVRSVATWNGSWRYGSAGAVVGPGGDLETLVEGLHALHGTYEVLRHALYRAAVADAGERFLQRRPGLSVLAWQPVAAEGAAGEATLWMDVLVDPADPVAALADSTDAIAWAVAAVAAERLIVGVDRLLLPRLGDGEPGAGRAVDLLAVVDEADRQGIEMVGLHPEASGTVVASPEATARIASHLAAGRAVIAPTRPVTLAGEAVTGWWVVDVAGGRVRDQMEGGGHQAGVEYGIATQPSRQAAPVLRRSLSRRIVCSIGRAVAVLDLLAALSGAPGAGETARGLAEGVAAVREAADKSRRAGRSVGGACNAASGPPV